MRLTIDHRSRYSFSEPQARIVQLLRVTPQDHGGQTVAGWRIDIDQDCRLREGRDGFGNITTMLYIDGPLTEFEISVHGEVLTEACGGRVSGAPDPLPPLVYTRQTVLTRADTAIEALAREGTKPQAINRLVQERARLFKSRPVLGRTAAQTLAEGQGTARDIAHLFASAVRVAGYPARFVAGHCLAFSSGPAARPHSWVEVLIDDEWIAFDPCVGALAEVDYVRVAAGLDASDATPISGAREGGGLEMLDVDVDVEIEDAGQAQQQQS